MDIKGNFGQKAFISGKLFRAFCRCFPVIRGHLEKGKNVLFRSYKGFVADMLCFNMLKTFVRNILFPETDTASSSANTQTGEVGAVSGVSTLFDSIDSQTPYIIAEKSSYDVDTPVLLTADTYGKYPDAVVALYEGKDKKTPSTSDKPVYTFQLSGYEGQTFDIKTGAVKVDVIGDVDIYECIFVSL